MSINHNLHGKLVSSHPRNMCINHNLHGKLVSSLESPTTFGKDLKLVKF